jgi:predicted dehydrogenase
MFGAEAGLRHRETSREGLCGGDMNGNGSRRMSALQVGFIGTGRISDLHALQYLADPRTTIVAVCDTDSEAARSRASSWNVAPDRVYTDYRELLANPDVDAVEILLPHHLHEMVGLDAIAAGKHVSLQKPMALTLAGADRIVDAAAASDRVIRIFENFIAYPPIRRVKQLIEAGEIGTPLGIRMKMLVGDSTRGWPVPAAASAWRRDPELCGGGPYVFDDGLHMFSVARYLFGMPAEVHAWIGETEISPGVVLDEPSIVTMRWADQRIGTLEMLKAPELEVNTRHYAEDDRIEISGTRGVVWMNRCHAQLWDEPPVVLYRDRRMTAMSDMPAGFEHGFIETTRDFIDAIFEGRTADHTPAAAREVLRIALAVQQSGREGRSVRL